jgi:hypothetical protein
MIKHLQGMLHSCATQKKLRDRYLEEITALTKKKADYDAILAGSPSKPAAAAHKLQKLERCFQATSQAEDSFKLAVRHAVDEWERFIGRGDESVLQLCTSSPPPLSPPTAASSSAAAALAPETPQSEEESKEGRTGKPVPLEMDNTFIDDEETFTRTPPESSSGQVEVATSKEEEEEEGPPLNSVVTAVCAPKPSRAVNAGTFTSYNDEIDSAAATAITACDGDDDSDGNDSDGEKGSRHADLQRVLVGVATINLEFYRQQGESLILLRDMILYPS